MLEQSLANYHPGVAAQGFLTAQTEETGALLLNRLQRLHLRLRLADLDECRSFVQRCIALRQGTQSIGPHETECKDHACPSLEVGYRTLLLVDMAIL